MKQGKKKSRCRYFFFVDDLARLQIIARPPAAISLKIERKAQAREDTRSWRPMCPFGESDEGRLVAINV
jgi:hypothetical protein